MNIVNTWRIRPCVKPLKIAPKQPPNRRLFPYLKILNRWQSQNIPPDKIQVCNPKPLLNLRRTKKTVSSLTAKRRIWNRKHPKPNPLSGSLKTPQPNGKPLLPKKSGRTWHAPGRRKQCNNRTGKSRLYPNDSQKTYRSNRKPVLKLHRKPTWAACLTKPLLSLHANLRHPKIPPFRKNPSPSWI